MSKQRTWNDTYGIHHVVFRESIVNDHPKIKGRLIVISAPSGAGKTSVLFEILKRHPEIKFSVSSTTRTPREGEKEGIDYHYVTEEEFDASIKQNDFLEWNTVHGNKYGTLKQSVDDEIGKGTTIILDTDTIGAFNIRKQYPDALLIFILPPSPKVLHERLMSRDTESHKHIKQRLEAAPREIARMFDYDYIVINDTLSTAVSQICAIIEAENLRSTHVFSALSEWRKYIDGKIPG